MGKNSQYRGQIKRRHGDYTLNLDREIRQMGFSTKIYGKLFKNSSGAYVRNHGPPSRTVENFMYASSLLNLILPNHNYSVPSWAVKQIEDDSEKIISAILSSMTKIEGDPYSISEVMNSARTSNIEKFAKTLEQNGIKNTTREGKKYWALRCETISRHLLKDTNFRDLDIQAPLSRIEGAISSHPVKILGKQERCVLIPESKFGLDVTSVTLM